MTKDHESVSIFGGSGYGKSYFALYFIENSFAEKKHCVIVDFKKEYSGLIKTGGFKVATFTQAMVQKLDMKKAVEILNKNPRLLINSYFVSVEEQQILCNIFAGALLYLGDAWFVLDEASNILENRFNRDLRYLYMISTQGRSEGLNTLFIYQRLGSISKITLSQSNIYFSFNLNEQNDLVRASAALGVNKEELMILKPRQYIYVNHRTGKKETLTTNGLKLKTQHLG